MSDDDGDDFMMDDEDEDAYEFDYEEDDDDVEDDNDTPSVDVENLYYNAKGRKDDDPDGALSDFQQVVQMEAEADSKGGDWTFKAVKQMVKLTFQLRRFDETLSRYEQLLGAYIGSKVTRNYGEKSVNNLLDYVSTAQTSDDTTVKFLQDFYSLTQHCVKELNNERLLIKTLLKLAKLLLDRKEFSALTKVLKQLRDLCEESLDPKSPNMSSASAVDVASMDFQRKGTHLLEIYALEIQMYTETKNNKKLKELYERCVNVKNAIPHPRIMGVIRECGGKMHMSEKEWVTAQQDFFEAFKNYDEAGSPQRIQCLKYLVLANMLSESEINPFDSQETKPYVSDPRIIAMTDLVAAYQHKEIRQFEKIMATNKDTIMDDPFIRMYIENVLQTIRTQVMVQLLKPYRKVKLDYIASQLGEGISREDVESLLILLILEERIKGRVDQIDGVVILERDSNKKDHKHIVDWNQKLTAACSSNLAKLSV